MTQSHDQADQDREWLAERFQEHRAHLKGVAYRMLGSLTEAEDAVQDAWLRLSRTDAEEIENLRAWLTTVVARVSLNMLRSRKIRREEPIEVSLPDPLVSREERVDPEHEALLSDSVGLALQVVLDTLNPAERLAFVLHDMFDVPFEEIAAMVGRSPDATRQLASRARRRVRGAAPAPDSDLDEQYRVVDAFFAAARGGDFEALVNALDPRVVLRANLGAIRPDLPRFVRGAEAVARMARMGARPTSTVHHALINGAAGAVIFENGQLVAVMAFTVRGGRIVEIDAISDARRLQQLQISPP